METIPNANEAANVIVLMARAEVLVEESKALMSRDRPVYRRIWSTRRVALLLQEADALLDEACLLGGMKPVPRPPRRWYEPGRRGLIFMQYACGTANALTAIMAASEGSWVSFVLSSLCVVVTAHWVIPRK